ncbi:MAG: hypothetical protein R3E96_05570 [Planctomycetota bacterium]
MEREPHPTPAVVRGQRQRLLGQATVPDASYNPGGGVLYDIPVVVHVLYSTSGTGNIPDARIFEQIQILNEDFGTLSGGNIQFHLATVDPERQRDHRHHPPPEHHLVQRWGQLRRVDRLGYHPLPEHRHQRPAQDLGTPTCAFGGGVVGASF